MYKMYRKFAHHFSELVLLLREGLGLHPEAAGGDDVGGERGRQRLGVEVGVVGCQTLQMGGHVFSGLSKRTHEFNRSNFNFVG